MDKYGYIGIETLLNFCENSKDHAVTPNDFMRMERVCITEPQIIHCNRCEYYQGVHNVQGFAPCNYWEIGAVLWNGYCSNAEPYREDGE